MEKLKGSTVLIVLGVALIAIGAAYPLVTLVVDTEPPTILSTNPANGSVVASVTALEATIKDSVSGVSSVSLGYIAPSTTVIVGGAATLVSGDKYQGTWQWTPPLPPTTPGQYKLTVTAKDAAGNTQYQEFTFTIYTQLQGKWYINDQEITSSSQTIYSKSTTVTFKFQKTAGIDDSYISCWVEEGGTKILTLSYTDSTNHIWTGSYTFSAGTHNLAIKAYDGTATITYSIVGLTIPGAVVWVMTTQQALVLAGVMALVAGVVMRVKKY
jgi:hypothetical protein